MITGSPARRVPVGPKTQVAVTPPESQVANYLVGQFRYYVPRYSRDGAKQIRVSKRDIYVSLALTHDFLKAVPDCTHVQIGVDPDRHLVEIKPAPTGSKVTLNRKDRKGLCVISQALARWLASFGVSDTYFPAQWQPQTQSIVGRYVPAQDAEQVDGAKLALTPKPLPASVRALGHKWILVNETSPSGGLLYRCEVCGYYASDPKNPLLKERPCKPHLYDGKYEIRDGKVYPAVTKESRKEASTGAEDQDGSEE